MFAAKLDVPDDHYQDLKRIIQATGGKAHRVNVIMPILYGADSIGEITVNP